MLAEAPVCHPAATQALTLGGKVCSTLQCKVNKGCVAMQGGHDIDKTTAADDGEGLDPREAARLLEQASRQAQREFDLRPPLTMAVAAGAILVGYGALWLSTRGQHPYMGPSGGAIALVYVAVAITIAVSARVYRRATAGVRGPAVRQQKLEGLAMLVSFLGSPVLQGAMKHYGAGATIVYGVIPAAAPLIIVGTTVLAIAAGKDDWPQLGAALIAIMGGAVAAFAGPSGAWLAAGIGLCSALLGYTAATAWLDRRRPRRS